MLAEVTSLSNAAKWHVDHINNSPDAEQALLRAMDWVRAEIRACSSRRPADADGFRRQLAHVIAGFAAEVPRSRPAFEFLAGPVPLPGGGWEPKPGTHARRP